MGFNQGEDVFGLDVDGRVLLLIDEVADGCSEVCGVRVAVSWEAFDADYLAFLNIYLVSNVALNNINRQY